MTDLTAIGEAVLAAIGEWQRTHPYAPSHRDLMAMTGVSTPSVIAYQLRILRERGLVSFVDGETRTVHLVGSHYALEGPSTPPRLPDWRRPY